MFDVNYLAVLLGTVASMVLGLVWYSPLLLGNHWMNLVGLSPEKHKENAIPAMIGMVVVSFILNYVLAHFVFFVNAQTWQAAVVLATWVWLGFVATTSLGGVLFAQRPLKLWLIDTGFIYVQLVVSAVILTLMK